MNDISRSNTHAPFFPEMLAFDDTNVLLPETNNSPVSPVDPMSEMLMLLLQAIQAHDFTEENGFGRLNLDISSLQPAAANNALLQLTIDFPLLIAPFQRFDAKLFYTSFILDSRAIALVSIADEPSEQISAEEIQNIGYNFHYKLKINHLNDKYPLDVYFRKTLVTNQWDMYYVFNSLVKKCILDFDENGLLNNEEFFIELELDGPGSKKIKIFLDIFNISLSCASEKVQDINEVEKFDESKLIAIVMIDNEVVAFYESCCLYLGKIVIENDIISFNKYGLHSLEYDPSGRVLPYSAFDTVPNPFNDLFCPEYADFLSQKGVIEYLAMITSLALIDPFPDLIKFNQRYQVSYQKMCIAAGSLVQYEFILLDEKQYAMLKDLYCNHRKNILLSLPDEEQSLVQVKKHYNRRSCQQMSKQYQIIMQNPQKTSLLLFSKDLQKALPEPVQDLEESATLRENQNHTLTF